MESPVESLHTTNSHDSEDDIEKSTHIRFLVSNGAAGSVIGRGGSTITKFQSHSGARIQLSRNNEFFPGTTDRIIMISGAIDEITNGMELILAKLSSEVLVEDGSDADPTPKLRLIVPNSSCGGIIGKGGATIKYFTDVSGARINISPQDYSYGITDRLVTITGSLEEQIHAVSLILWKLAEDSHYPQSLNAAFTYAGVVSYPPYGGYMARPVRPSTYNGSNGDHGKFQNDKDDRSNSVTFGVPDEHIGLVVGRGGRNIMEISQASGARIKISDRGDFVSGTSDRKVTITGSKAAIHTAKDMIMQKVAYTSEG